MMIFLLALLTLTSLGILGYYAWQHWRVPPEQEAPTEVSDQKVASLPPIAGSGVGWFNVLSGEHLLAHCKAQSLLSDIERQSRLSHEVFMRDMYPAITAYVEFIQLAPASEAHHHSHIGGLIAHTLEVVLAALTARNGYLLPLHANTELIDAQRDHWTYAVFYAALLHDVGKVLTDLQIDIRDTPQAQNRRWLPLSGPMHASRALEYQIQFAPKSERDYQAHQRLALVMLQAMVPSNALAFLGRKQNVLTALTKYLSGEDAVIDEGAKALSEIVKRADSFSVSRNLAHGTRQRFVTATAVPLNELLMQAIRHMLRDGTKLPLNRNGAAGWVYDGAIWFVAKRLADTVRKHIQEHHPDESIPGGNKNDRLFDTWQDYGLIEPNPNSGGAIWKVIVQGPDYELPPFPVLKFPLHRLFDAPTQYPIDMQGSITILTGEKADAVQVELETEAESDIAPPEDLAPEETVWDEGTAAAPAMAARSAPDGLLDVADAVKTTAPVATSSKAPATISASSNTAPNKSPSGTETNAKASTTPAPKPVPSIDRNAFSIPGPKPVSKQGTTGGNSKTLHNLGQGSEKGADPKPVSQANAIPAPPNGVPKPQPKPASNEVPVAAPTPAPAKVSTAKPPQQPTTKADSNEFLPGDGDVATYEDEKQGLPHKPLESAKTAPETIKPVMPHAQPPKIIGNKKEPDPMAIEFVQWVQQGLASGTITYNQADSLVHIVPEGIALVSPRIFKEFLIDEAVTDVEYSVLQRKVTAAGWHQMGENHSNILHYQVVANGKRRSKLSAVVLRNPKQWLAEVPPANPHLAPFELEFATKPSHP
ncbi:MobH family relaxase [Uliginosibacterium gangwonense]|uniref:MobH family relaxase n=1 Tax=Uliginosibacterium gangwonense TaxID=392736 RepID=UPI00037916A8|nr:MobH family relaxase [Uliginosibacterium gangwonense]